MSDSSSHNERAENVFLGSVFICLSAAMFAAAGAAVKVALQDLAPIQLVFWRNLLSMVLFGSFLLVARPQTFKALGTRKFSLHLTRSILSLLVLYSYFFAVSRVPLSTAVLLMSTSPVFVPILAYFLLRRRSARTVWVGVLIAFFGVALVIDPTLSYDFTSLDRLGILAGVAAGFLGGAATIAIWKMSATEPPDRQIFFFTLISFVLSIPVCVLNWRMPNAETFVPILCLGIATTFAQYFLSRGCQLAPADKINTWNYLSIVFAALAAYIGWNETLSMGMIAGIILVVIGAHTASRQ